MRISFTKKNNRDGFKNWEKPAAKPKFSLMMRLFGKRLCKVFFNLTLNSVCHITSVILVLR